jgi:hypothetical protein
VRSTSSSVAVAKPAKDRSRRTLRGKGNRSSSSKKAQHLADMAEQLERPASLPPVPEPPAPYPPAPEPPAPEPSAPLPRGPSSAAADKTLFAIDAAEYQGLGNGLGPVRHLTREEYAQHVDERLRLWYDGIFDFGHIVHVNYVTKNWKGLVSGVSGVANLHFPRSVDWKTLDAETQKMMKAWAPKADEYMGVWPRGNSKLAACFPKTDHTEC